jgi:hypothetical protein
LFFIIFGLDLVVWYFASWVFSISVYFALNFHIFCDRYVLRTVIYGCRVFTFGVPLSFPSLLAYFPELFLWWSVLNPLLSDAALSMWQGTDQPHVCPSLGGPATE